MSDESIAKQLAKVAKKYSTKGGGAKAIYKKLRQMAEECGQNPDIEVLIFTPEETEARGYGKNWSVSWEAGPYEWAIAASMEIRGKDAKWYTEPYYSFDLHFTY